MNKLFLRRGLFVLIVLVWLAVIATPAHADSLANDLMGVTDARLIYPHIDGVDDLTGQVQRVAIIDTGIDFDHPALDGRVVAGINYAANAKWGSSAAVDYNDGHGHGTFVAGVIGGNSSRVNGVAPSVEFIAIRALSNDGTGSFNDVARGLEWVANNADAYNITAVNVSIGTDSTYAVEAGVPFWSIYDRIENALGTLESLDIVTSVASGNSGSSTGLSVPAIYDESLAVGASTFSDTLYGNTNRSAELELLAPGSGIYSTWKDGGHRYGSGTSYASPMVAGLSVLLRETYLQFTDDLAGGYDSFQDRVVDLLQQTGTPILDGASGLTFFRPNLDAAISSIYLEHGVYVPEPTSLAMLVFGGMIVARRRKR